MSNNILDIEFICPSISSPDETRHSVKKSTINPVVQPKRVKQPAGALPAATASPDNDCPCLNEEAQASSAPIPASGSTTPFKQLHPAYSTREEWLRAAIKVLDVRVFSKAGYPLPPVATSVGFPSTMGISKKRRCLGECWKRIASDDGINQIFLNPTLNSAHEVVDVLVHELVHAVDDCASGHGSTFRKICKAVGLTEGTPASAAAGADLVPVIEEICKDIGEFPHATLRPSEHNKKQTTRLRKIECPKCGYTCRITSKWAEIGMPVCPCGFQRVAVGDWAAYVGARSSHQSE